MTRAFLVLIILAGCGSKNGEKKPLIEPPVDDDAGRTLPATDASVVTLPPAPPLPTVPAGLPAAALPPTVTPDAVALGELLFWDPRLSSTGTLSCAGCHDPARGFAGATRQDTAAGKPNLRRAPALVNLAWQRELGWDGRYPTMAEHLGPHVRGQLGLDLAESVARISGVAGYRAHFTRLGSASASAAANALGAYVLTRYAGDATWDRLERSPDVYATDETGKKTQATRNYVKAGYQLFNTKAQCSVCHTPPLYTDLRYHRLGLIASPDEGRGRIDASMKGAFKTPTLRDAALRPAFFHDASAASLDAAIEWHLLGGTGQGADPSIIDLKPVVLSPQEREQLRAFVRALSDLNRPEPTEPSKPALP